MKLHTKCVTAAAALLALAVSATSVSAQDNTPNSEYDPFGSDPLGLIAQYQTTSFYTSKLINDVFDVWVCDMGNNSSPNFNPEDSTKYLNRDVAPFFEWLSRDKYNLTFRLGGTVKTQFSGSNAGREECLESVAALTKQKVASGQDAPNGVIVLGNTTTGRSTDIGEDVVWGRASLGGFMGDPQHIGWLLPKNGGLYPENGRYAFWYTLAPHDDTINNHNLAAHEIGHTFGWPHAYGETFNSDGTIRKLGNRNRNDFISGAYSGIPPDNPKPVDPNHLYVGTIAINRYAAGWIDPSEVAIHTGTEPVTYKLATVESVYDDPNTLQMLVLPLNQGKGFFEVLGARARTGYDSNVPSPGVERYRIDQRETACEYPRRSRISFYCAFSQRLTMPFPYVAEELPINWGGKIVTKIGSSANVYNPGEWFQSGDFFVGITERSDNNVFTVTVTKGCPYPVTVVTSQGSWFCDDDGSVHETAIEALAESGVELACNTEQHRFCPSDPVTRADMAAFLSRALNAFPGANTNRILEGDTFSDVADDAWYGSYVNQLVGLGITRGYSDGTYRPNKLVTRSQMATFFVRAFDRIEAVTSPTSSFTDITSGGVHSAAIEGMLETGITAGCNTQPLRYCPQDPITRAQMASFIARALGLTTR